MTRRLFVGLMLIAGTIGGWALPGHGQATRAVHVAVDAGKPGAAIPPGLFGVFFEDINFAADGGLYPERSRTARSSFPSRSWGGRAPTRRRQGTLLALNGGGRQTAPIGTTFASRPTRGAGFGVANEGFRGIGVAAGET